MRLWWVVRKDVCRRARLSRGAVIERTWIRCTIDASHQRKPGSQRGGRMTESTHEAVLHRLVRVERAMRRWQVSGSLALALLWPCWC